MGQARPEFYHQGVKSSFPVPHHHLYILNSRCPHQKISGDCCWMKDLQQQHHHHVSGLLQHSHQNLPKKFKFDIQAKCLFRTLHWPPAYLNHGLVKAAAQLWQGRWRWRFFAAIFRHFPTHHHLLALSSLPFHLALQPDLLWTVCIWWNTDPGLIWIIVHLTPPMAPLCQIKMGNGTEKMRKLLGIKSKPENDKDANRNKAAARGEIAFDMMATIQSSGDTNCLLIILSSLLLISSAKYSKCWTSDLQKVFLHQRGSRPNYIKKKESLVRDPAQSTVDSTV